MCALCFACIRCSHDWAGRRWNQNLIQRKIRWERHCSGTRSSLSLKVRTAFTLMKNETMSEITNELCHLVTQLFRHLMKGMYTFFITRKMYVLIMPLERVNAINIFVKAQLSTWVRLLFLALLKQEMNAGRKLLINSMRSQCLSFISNMTTVHETLNLIHLEHDTEGCVKITLSFCSSRVYD